MKESGVSARKMVSIDFICQILPNHSLSKFTPRDDIVPYFYKCTHVKRPKISTFGKVRRFPMVFPTFWVVKLNKKRKDYYILAFHCLFWAFEKKKWQKSAFSGFFLHRRNFFRKKYTFWAEKRFDFPGNL